MSKKAKKRKHRKLSSSSSEDDEKTARNTKKSSKRKYVTPKEKNEVKVQKAKDLSSSKEEAQGKRQIKKPVYRLEKTKSTRGQSPIFKEEESKDKDKHSVQQEIDISSKSKSSESSSSKDRWVASSSKNIFVPRSVSGQKLDGHRPPVTKRRRDVTPETDAPKTKETKKSSLVTQVILPLRNEPVKKNQHHQDHQSFKAQIKSKVQITKETSTATISSKMPPGPQEVKEKKEYITVSSQPGSKIFNKIVVAEKSALDRKLLPIKSNHKPATCEAKSPCNVEPYLKQSKIPAAVTDKKTTTASSSSQKKKCATVSPQPHSAPLNFRIPKKAATPEISPAKDNKSLLIKSAHITSMCEATTSVSQCSSSITSSNNPWPSLVSPECQTDPSPWQDQIMVVEQLHHARSEKHLEVHIMQSYGELTCMEIDPPEERAADTQLPQQDLIIVLDTNILISHLDYVKKMVSRGLEVCFPVILVPWVVLQELDSLKKGRGVSGSVAHSAIPAIAYIYNCLKGKESRLWGQSMQQAAESMNGLNAENNDDRVLQCCLQYQLLYPECAVILCTNDKNLCSKALLSGVKAFSKTDLEREVARFSHGVPFLNNLQASIRPQASISTLAPGKIHALAEAQSQETTSLCVEKENNQPQEANAARRSSSHLRSLVCQFESVLQEALSDVLEAEMKAAFEDLWLEIVYRKPPWSLSDVLQCLKKHWFAVFGQVVSRAKHQNVLNLIEFFNSGKGVDHSSTLVALREAKDLLKEFEKSSSCVPGAISAVDCFLNTLQTQGETSGGDVVMKEAEEDKRTMLPPMSHAEVWALFVNIWQHVYHTSIEVFKAVDFDPKASQSVRPTGGAPPPRDALACLHKLLCIVSQLLQAFSSFLTSFGLAEAQSLLNAMHSTEIVNVDKVTATDILNCFAQEEYRERLRVGGSQLLEVQAALSSCLEFTAGHVPFTV